MKEVKEILQRVSTFAPDERAVLATVIDLQGSGYRRPGARMLILPNGETFGMVSGGCLESDVMARAKKVLQTGRAEVFTYDTTRDENSVFSLNMGCRGVIRILLESIGRDSPLLHNLHAVRTDRQHRTMATFISHDTSSDTEFGGRLFRTEDGVLNHDRLPGFLQNASELKAQLDRFHQSGSPYAMQAIKLDEGTFEFAFESLKPPVLVLLFGAGADAVPFAKIASQLGWGTRVFDHRPAFLTKERFADADQLVLLSREQPIEHLVADERVAGARVDARQVAEGERSGHRGCAHAARRSPSGSVRSIGAVALTFAGPQVACTHSAKERGARQPSRSLRPELVARTGL